MINVITVDGPSGAGKGTLTQMLAEHLGWHILDSGALYRILGVACEQAGIDLSQQTIESEIQRQVTKDFMPCVWQSRCSINSSNAL